MNPKPDSLAMVRAGFGRLLSERPCLLLDGAMGTELERRGFRTVLPLWSAMANVEAPALVKEIHDAYIDAGADIITANTFRTTSHTFSKVNKQVLGFYVTRLAVEIARESIVQCGRPVFLAGSLAPVEDCYSPDLVPDRDTIHAVYAEQTAYLMEAGADLILCETMINRDEAVIAAEICAVKGYPFMMSFTAADGKLLDGTPLESIVPDIDQYNPLALLLNCRSPQVITDHLVLLRRLTATPTGAYGNGPGKPDPETGWQPANGGEEAYAEAAAKWYQNGARIIGGCCGTTPETIRRVKEILTGSQRSSDEPIPDD